VNNNTIPTALNVFLLCLASLLNTCILYTASHSENWILICFCALCFSFTNNTTFSLLHEAVHGIFAENAILNGCAGRLAAAWFPTGFSIQRAFHMTHHANNRSPFEQFDVIHKGDIKWLKYAQWYSIMTGIYWLVTVAGVTIFCLLPQLLKLNILHRNQSQTAIQTSGTVNPWLVRLEILLTICFQITMFWLFDLKIVAWLICYAAFAFNWSSLQYTDHAFSPLDQRHGAWNLRTGLIGRLFFLNYHLHLAHHQNPRTPWFYLPKLIEKDSLQPSFYRVWFESWKGPRPLNKFPDFSK
jgi:fatty acid desaturase